MRTRASKILLSAVTASGAGSETLTTVNLHRFTAYITRSGTVNATVDIQAKTPSGSWVSIDSLAYTTTGTRVVQWDNGRFTEIRANVTAYTSGTITVELDAGGDD